MPKTLATAAAVLVLTGAATITAAAVESPSLPKVVSENPANYTPNVVDDSAVKHTQVYAIRQLGSTMYAGGTFHRVKNAPSVTGSHHGIVRHNVFSFSAQTGKVRAKFSPHVNGAVWDIQPYRNKLFIGGEFTSVDGTPRMAIAKIDTNTGSLIGSFKPSLRSGRVTEIRLVHGRLIVGGTFAKNLVALDPRTGKDTGYIKMPIRGSVASNAGPTSVYRFAVSPDDSRLVAVGNMTSVDHHARSRAFMLDLGHSKASLDSWHYKPLADLCKSPKTPDQLRDVDFSPNGEYFVVAAGGYVSYPQDLGKTICDAAARFETSVAHPSVPTWINYTGGDTLQSVAVTGSAVYVQGHQRWLDNPQGHDSAGPGAKPRQGIGALDSRTGKALAWNPTKSRNIGGKDFLATRHGLWVASDGPKFGNEVHEDIAFLPE